MQVSHIMKHCKLFAFSFCITIVLYFFVSVAFKAAANKLDYDLNYAIQITLLLFSVFVGGFLFLCTRKRLQTFHPESKRQFIFFLVLSYLLLWGIGLLPISFKSVLLPQLLWLSFTIPGILFYILLVIIGTWSRYKH